MLSNRALALAVGLAVLPQTVHAGRWEERPLALIVRDPKTTPPVSEEDIKPHVLFYSEKGTISKFAVPQKILFVEALAKTSVGKFDKKALRAQYGNAV